MSWCCRHAQLSNNTNSVVFVGLVNSNNPASCVCICDDEQQFSRLLCRSIACFYNRLPAGIDCSNVVALCSLIDDFRLFFFLTTTTSRQFLLFLFLSFFLPYCGNCINTSDRQLYIYETSSPEGYFAYYSVTFAKGNALYTTSFSRRAYTDVIYSTNTKP